MRKIKLTEDGTTATDDRTKEEEEEEEAAYIRSSSRVGVKKGSRRPEAGQNQKKEARKAKREALLPPSVCMHAPPSRLLSPS